MNENKFKIGKVLPLVCAGIGALAFASHLLFGFLTEQFVGSPSSTSAVVIIFIPIYAGVGAIIGWFVGRVTYSITNSAFKEKTLSGSSVARIFSLSGITVIIFAGYSGYATANKYIQSNKSGTFHAEGRILKDEMSAQDKLKDQSEIVKESDTDVSISWNNKNLSLRFGEHSIRIWDPAGDMKIKSSLKGYDYINELQLIEVALFPPDEKRHLAIFARLRATSRNAMLLIYSPDGALIYEELIGGVYQAANISTEKISDSNLETLLIDRGRGSILSWEGKN